MSEEKRTVEINGIKFEVDMRTAVRVDQFHVGDNIKILDKTYSSSTIKEGVIVDFLNFKELPTIQIAYFDNNYSGAEIKFLNINKETEDYEILPSNPHEFGIEKNKVVEKMQLEIQKKLDAADEMKHKLDWFLKFYGKYFEHEEA